MRRQSLIRIAMLLGPLALLGCSADQTSVVITTARAAGDKCDFGDDSVYVSGGSVDMRPYDVGTPPVTLQSASFVQVFSWENNLTSIPLSVNGQVIDPGAGNNFVADTAHFSYQYSAAGQTFEDEIANMHAVITAGATPKDNSVGFELIQPKAAAKLLTIVNTTPQTLLVTFWVSGKLTAGSSLTTNKVSFPITVYQSAASTLTCPAGQVPTTTCGEVGRDSNIGCITPM
jgi:hypothetical protein